MRKLMILVLATNFLLAGSAAAVELSSVRVTTGFLGSVRPDKKFLPGDVLIVNFDIKGLSVDKEEGTVVYQIKMEVFDAKGKEVFTQLVPAKKVLLMGGNNVPSFAVVSLGSEQDAGKYKTRITVTDMRAKANKSFDYDFEVLPRRFGIVQPNAPAAAFVGQDLSVGFAVMGMKRDKDKLPKVSVSLEVLDETGQKVIPKVVLRLEDLHDPVLNDLSRIDVIPNSFALFLNRPGRFTFQVEAIDEIGNQKAQVRMPLRVLDVATVGGE